MKEIKRPFFTVVMPAYGVEQYLEDAVESIRTQSFADWELVIVDDGSPDGTGRLADRLKKKDERIRVIHHLQNRGLSEARNTGIDAAKGRYIWFMDPDDRVDPDLLEKVYLSLKENPAQLVIFGHTEEYYDADGRLNYTHRILPEKKRFSTKGELRPYVIRLEQETIYGYAWNKMYSLDYIREKNLRFETVTLIEDIVFNIQYCMDIESMNILDITPYHYAKRMEGSLTTKFVPDYYKLHHRRIRMLYEQQQYWHTDTEETCAVLGSLYGRYILSALERNCDKRSGMKHKDRKAFCKGVFGSPLFRALIPKAQAQDSRALKIALRLMKSGNIASCLALGRAVHVIRSGMPMLYSKVKSER